MDELQGIINECKKNNRNAQAKLYAALAPKLLGVCLRYMNDRDEAEDVMQESFVKIFTNLGSYRGEGSFEGWTKRIAANTALTALKKRKAIQFERDLVIVENIDFSAEECRDVLLEEVMDCLNYLPDGYRTIINLFLVEEFSHKEIAEQLNISESTSRSQYSRARQVLLKALKTKKNIEVAKNA